MAYCWKIHSEGSVGACRGSFYILWQKIRKFEKFVKSMLGELFLPPGTVLYNFEWYLQIYIEHTQPLCQQQHTQYAYTLHKVNMTHLELGESSSFFKTVIHFQYEQESLLLKFHPIVIGCAWALGPGIQSFIVFSV